MSVLRAISYHPALIRAARALGLRQSLRKLYFVWARPRNGIMTVKLGTFDCRFYVRTPEELRVLGKAASGQWRIEVIQFLARELNEGDVVYDIGSNIGVCSVFAAKTVGEAGRAIAFEPARQTREHLQDNFRLNSLANARACQVAFSDFSAEGVLFTGDDLLFSSLAALRGQKNAQPVRLVEGDRFREEMDLPPPHVVMIDVEGFEFAAIRGFQKTLSSAVCRCLACEVHPTLLPSGVRAQDVLDTLGLCGFRRIDIHRCRGIPEFYVFAYKS